MATPSDNTLVIGFVTIVLLLKLDRTTAKVLCKQA